MTVALGTLPWLLWTLAFIALEANGFRRANDRWPTLSQLVKWFEQDRDWQRPTRVSDVWWPDTDEPIVVLGHVDERGNRVLYSEPRLIGENREHVKVDEPHGLIAWTWRRWLIALGLPLIAILLELHWVWEVV